MTKHNEKNIFKTEKQIINKQQQQKKPHPQTQRLEISNKDIKICMN